MEDIPQDLNDLINEHAKDSPSCINCLHSCCFESGFAIKKNVELIYELYAHGKLIRNDYTFKPDLSFDEFVNIYFDVVKYVPYKLTMYFPRHLAYDNVALIVRPDNETWYWDYRHNILTDPINECKGCIFLESSMNYNDQTSRRCILHNKESQGKIYEKPLDCILLSCNQNRKVKKLNEEDNQLYFSLLSKYYGDIE